MIDPEKHTVTVAGITIRPVRRHFALYSLLARRPGVIFPRDQIMDALGLSLEADWRTVDTLVKRMRREMREAGMPPMICTLYGEGYYWRD